MSGPGIVLLLAGWMATADPLPVVEETDWTQLRQQAEQLLRVSSLPAETQNGLRKRLADAAPPNPGEAVVALQKILDPFCLVSVNINPESRVKVARGPAKAELPLEEETLVLIKVHNEAGVTHSLGVSGTQLRDKTTGKQQPPDAEGERWLSARMIAPLRLSGQKLDYALLGLRPHESGKREATLRFDVGQGSQDLGFRAEIPILFTILPAAREND